MDFFSGKIREVRAYDQALDAAEIERLGPGEARGVAASGSSRGVVKLIQQAVRGLPELEKKILRSSGRWDPPWLKGRPARGTPDVMAPDCPKTQTECNFRRS